MEQKGVTKKVYTMSWKNAVSTEIFERKFTSLGGMLYAARYMDAGECADVEDFEMKDSEGTIYVQKE